MESAGSSKTSVTAFTIMQNRNLEARNMISHSYGSVLTECFVAADKFYPPLTLWLLADRSPCMPSGSRWLYRLCQPTRTIVTWLIAQGQAEARTSQRCSWFWPQSTDEVVSSLCRVIVTAFCLRWRRHGWPKWASFPGFEPRNTDRKAINSSRGVFLSVEVTFPLPAIGSSTDTRTSFWNEPGLTKIYLWIPEWTDYRLQAVIFCVMAP